MTLNYSISSMSNIVLHFLRTFVTAAFTYPIMKTEFSLIVSLVSYIICFILLIFKGKAKHSHFLIFIRISHKKYVETNYFVFENVAFLLEERT